MFVKWTFVTIINLFQVNKKKERKLYAVILLLDQNVRNKYLSTIFVREKKNSNYRNWLTSSFSQGLPSFVSWAFNGSSREE